MDTATRGRSATQGNTSVLTLVATESSSDSIHIGYSRWRGIKGIYIFQYINKRSSKDCYGKVIDDAVAGEFSDIAVAGEVSGVVRAG